MQKIKIPLQTTVKVWNEKYEKFSHIFDNAYLEPLKKEMNYSSELLPSKVFTYFLYKQATRIVMPKMTFDSLKDNGSIRQIQDLIELRSNGLKYKYDLLADTMPQGVQSIKEYFNNFDRHTEGRKEKDYDEGTVTHSGADSVYNNVDKRTSHYSTTGDSEQPRLEGYTEDSTFLSNDDPKFDRDNNKIKTSYGHIVTAQPSNEINRYTEDSNGYYNVGSKPKLIEDVRNILNFNLTDAWLHDIMSIFCFDYYA